MQNQTNNAPVHTVWDLVRHEFTGIIRTTDKAYLLQLVDKLDRGLWVPKSMLIGMTVNPINKRIVAYIPDFCNSKEVSIVGSYNDTNA